MGHSGNGKSTCLQLLQRFYDPDEGEILIDDLNVKTFDVSLLRSKMAIVGQEPVLFAATIRENIRYGKMDATDKEIICAAQEAGAHEFIVNLPQVGSEGA